MKLGTVVFCLPSLIFKVSAMIYLFFHFAQSLCCLFSWTPGPNFPDKVRDLNFALHQSSEVQLLCRPTLIILRLQGTVPSHSSAVCPASLGKEYGDRKSFMPVSQECFLVASKLCTAAAMLLLCSFQRSKYISMKMS